MLAEVPAIGWNPQEGAEQVPAGALAADFDGNVPADLDKAVVEGQQAHVLAEASRGAEMLVGSVSTAVAAHAHCPVLITHTEPDPAR
ncbi:universal stress protein [Arthrobacter sp. E918]|uniref:Universal stress protein n=2 Tax=Arthrobacter mobilis TaxID=2724944 RepID=A0A7X6HD17_9MICC|nr:universal stress protein [Arthrobacter mobilis]